MKTATIRQRRTLRDGKHLVQVVCPLCQGRHWIPATDTVGQCPRRPGTFTTTQRKTG